MASDEWEDKELGRVLGIGIAIGVPTMFLIAIVLQLASDFTLWQTAAVALLPAFFVGPYVGGLVLMAKTSRHHEVPTH